MTSLPFVLLLATLPETDIDLRISPSSDDGRAVRVVATLPDERLTNLPVGEVSRRDGQQILQFAVLDDDGNAGRAMLGRYTREGQTLTFKPRHPLVVGRRYQASLTLGKLSRRIEYRVRARTLKTPSATVTEVYPTADTLPANTLKFYIHFSKPMRRGRAIFDRIRLLDSDGEVIPDPWRRTELWTVDDRRFTLWIHPGRVKQGVNLREELGPVLQPGHRYTLVIGSSLQDEDGRPLVKEFRRSFRTGAEDHSIIRPNEWRVSVPTEDSREPLCIDLHKPLDHALLLRCLEVRNQSGGVLAGEWKTEADDSVVLFQPESGWKTGDYQLVVDGILEDLAGNTPLRAFDTDLTQESGRIPTLRIPFRVLSPSR